LSTTGLTWAGIEPRPPWWSMRSIYITYKNSVPTSQRTHSVLLEGHGWILFREVTLFTVKLIQNKCTVWQSTCFLVTGGGTYIYHCALNGFRSVRRIYVSPDDRQISRSIEATCYIRAEVSLCALHCLPIEVRHTYH
jgi:hypothetical protein